MRWRLRDASGSESVDFNTNFADSGWVVQVEILCPKIRVSQDGSKSAKDRHMLISFEEIWVVCKKPVFSIIFLCFG